MLTDLTKGQSKELVFGLLGQGNKITAAVQFTNISETPEVSYIPDPVQFLAFLKYTTKLNPRATLDFIGIFHNHPKTPALPSPTDIYGSTWDGVYLISSPLYNELNAYSVNSRTWKPITIYELS